MESKNYPGLDTNITHLEDEACAPTYRDESKAVFKFGLEECRTKQEDDGKVIHYKNRIIAVVKDVDEEEHITRKSTRVLPFECSFKKKVVLSKVSYSPGYTQLITNAGNYTFPPVKDFCNCKSGKVLVPFLKLPSIFSFFFDGLIALGNYGTVINK